MAGIVGSQERAWSAEGVPSLYAQGEQTALDIHHDINTTILAEEGEFMEREIHKVQ